MPLTRLALCMQWQDVMSARAAAGHNYSLLQGAQEELADSQEQRLQLEALLEERGIQLQNCQQRVHTLQRSLDHCSTQIVCERAQVRSSLS